MRKVILLAAVLLVASISASAQTTAPNVEVFGGYSYLNTKFIDRENLNGFGVSFAGNFGDKWGFVAETSGNYGHARVPVSIFFPDGKVSFSKYLFLFGPRYSKRGDHATVFGHVLLGGAREKVEGIDTGSGFAIAVGGGVDVNAGKSFAIRVFQVDFVPDRSSGSWQSNFRVQTGIVLKF